MARLGTPAERKVAAAVLAAMPPEAPNPMAAGPRVGPPVVTVNFGGGQTVNVTHVIWQQAGAIRSRAEFEAAMAKVEEQLAQAVGESAALGDALRKMAEEVRKAAYATYRPKENDK